MRHDKRTHSAKGGSSSNQQPNRFSRQSKNSKVSNEEGVIDDDVTEQVEFGVFQKLGDKSTKKQGAV